jgi:hypothetical protein
MLHDAANPRASTVAQNEVRMLLCRLCAENHGVYDENGHITVAYISRLCKNVPPHSMMAQLPPRFTEHAFDHHPVGSTHLHSSSRPQAQAAPGSCQHAYAWPHAWPARSMPAGCWSRHVSQHVEALAVMLPACTGMLRSCVAAAGALVAPPSSNVTMSCGMRARYGII